MKVAIASDFSTYFTVFTVLRYFLMINQNIDLPDPLPNFLFQLYQVQRRNFQNAF